jgi:hypothetical protein
MPGPTIGPVPGPAFFLFRCAMGETLAVRRKAPVSAAANPHIVLAKNKQPSS